MKRFLSTLIFLFVIALIQLAAQNRVYTPNLIEPEDGALGQVPDVILNWQAVSGVHGEVTYDLQLDTDPAFSNPVEFSTDLSGYQMKYLTFGQEYYWRVRAIDGPDMSGWSDVWSFKVLNTMELMKPKDFKADQFPDVELGWKPITGADFYDIQIDTSFYWKNMTGITGNNLNDADNVSEDEAWIVGDNGTIVHYAGDTFTLVQDTLIDSDLFSVSMLDATTGVIVGADGAILVFDGTLWDTINDVTTADIHGVHMLAADNAWAVGAGGLILNWDGVMWNEVTGISEDLNAVYFVDENNGWAVGAGGFVAYYNGTEWTEQTSAVTKDLLDVYFVTANYGWACGAGGRIQHYNGFEWMEFTSGVSKDLHAVAFLNETQGYAIGLEGNLLEFNGVEWFNTTIGLQTDYYALDFFGGSSGFAAGKDGTIMKYGLEGFATPGNIIHVPGDVDVKKMEYLLFGEVYAWRVRARHANDTSGWSPVWSFITIAAPEPQKPADDSENLGLFEKFEWKKITGVVDYTLEISQNPEFTTPLIYISESNIDSIEFYHFGYEYYWRVKANHLEDESDWSPVWHFTITDIVSLSLPQNGAVNQPVRPTLSWDKINGVDGYELIYDTLPDMINPCCEQIVEAPNNDYRIGLPLEGGRTYYWKVRAFKGIDTTMFSETRSFTVIEPQGVDEIINENDIAVYPNPSNGYLNISLQADDQTRLQIYVMDLVGQVLVEKELAFTKGQSVHKLDLNNLPNGIYLIRFRNGEQQFSKKINLFK